MSEFTTGVCRIVAGDLFTGQYKDDAGKPYLDSAGQPQPRYFFAVALPKTDPVTAEIINAIHAAGAEGFPRFFQGGQCVLPTFAFKYDDGDSVIPNSRGRKPCDKEGYPGHYVLKFGTTIKPRVVEPAVGGVYTEVTDPNKVKRGYYVRVNGNICSNNNDTKPGVYLNPRMVLFVQPGEEIHTGPDAVAVFGAASAPVAVPPVATPPVAVPPPAPAHDFADGPDAKFVYNGAQYTRAQLQASGWADAQINTLPRA